MNCDWENTNEPGRYRCRRCGFVLPIAQPHPPERIFRNCDASELINPPNTLQKIKNALKSSKNIIKSGGKKTSKEERQKRLEICSSCNFNKKNTCLLCGCRLKGKIIAKVNFKEERCPLNLWPYFDKNNEMAPIFNREGNKATGLENLYNKSSCFFIGAGPSLENIDLSQLTKRGIITCATNNVAANIIRPNIWISVDNPKSFCKKIWDDPFIMKFVSQENLGKPVLELKNGKYSQTKRAVYSCPNIFSYRRNSFFREDKFLTEDTINWGMNKDKRDKNGNKGCRSVFMASIKILYFLGIRTIYLIGCDFNMKPERPYVFKQDKHQSGCHSNNKCYEIMNDRFIQMKDHFKENHLKIFNCTEGSKLTAFEFIDFQDAINKVTKNFPDNVETDGMYGRT